LPEQRKELTVSETKPTPEQRDDRELAEDLEPTDETARDVTAGAPSVSDIPVTKPVDKPSPIKP
jgi:hypothetical protein